MTVYLGMPATGSEQVRPELPNDVVADPKLLGIADGTFVHRTAAALGGGPARLLLPVRRQDRLMEHAHLDLVRRGGSTTFAEQFPRPARPSLDWADLAERLAAIPGVERVDVLPLDFGASPLQQVLGALALPSRPEPGEPPTLSVRGIRVARSLNAHLANDTERELVRDFVASTFPGPRGPNLFLSAATRARVLAAYAAANRRLFRDWLPAYSVDAWNDAEEKT